MNGEGQILAETSFLSEEDQKSVNILKAVQNSDWFAQDGNDVRLYYDSEGGRRPSATKFSIDDYLKAVDFYCQNRSAGVMVDLAMTKQDGTVRVYAPSTGSSEERPVVLEVKNYMVPRILELAYLLVHSKK